MTQQDQELPNGIVRGYTVCEPCTKDGANPPDDMSSLHDCIEHGPFLSRELAVSVAHGRGVGGGSAPLAEGTYIILDGMAYQVEPSSGRPVFPTFVDWIVARAFSQVSQGDRRIVFGTVLEPKAAQATEARG